MRNVLMFLISLALAAVVAFSANRWMTERLAGAKPHMNSAAAAAKDIPFGAELDATMVKVVPLPAEAIPEKAFTDPKAVIGRVAAVPLFKGEILIEGRVVEHLGGSSLAAVVPAGKRAITVGVNEIAGVAGFVLPGNRVDLLTVIGDRAQTLLQNLKVLAVDQTASTDKSEPVLVRAVTLEVTPEEAEIIAKATENSKIRFTLRNPQDGNVVKPPLEQPVTVAPAPPPEVHQEPQKIMVIRGMKESWEIVGIGFTKGQETDH